MDSLNELEIQNIRHICGMSTLICDKTNYYKTITQDKTILDIFDKICANSTNLKNDLSGIL
jgi:hypothetical protein